MIRTGYSFRTAVGSIEEVQSRLVEIGWNEAPVCDRASTFSFNRWTMAAKTKGLRPIYGVEIAVVPMFEKKPRIDHWRFLAKDSLRSLHDLIYEATGNSQRDPQILYQDVDKFQGLIKISGSRLLLDNMNHVKSDFYVALSPSSPKPLIKEALRRGFPLCAISDNFYPRKGDEDMYSVVMGRRREHQTYLRHILDDEELRAACWQVEGHDFDAALVNRYAILDSCRAELKKATMIVPRHDKTLLAMCQEGAAKKNCDLSNPIYAERLEREMRIIREKNFDDYFFVVADLLQWAKTQMICGPGRGSSSGSLVCYLLDITTADPIKYDLVFERFIDITRPDFPDIDIDLSDKRRDLAFEYLERKYGKDRVARLGTVGMFQSKSAINAAGMAIGVPQFMLENASNAIITRSKGDSRADYKIEDSFKITEAGKKLIAEYPSMAIAGRIEAHPQFRGQHSAGMVLTNDPVREYVAVDSSNKVAMCDWQDAKDLDLLKIDVLGLTQLSIFEQTLRLVGKSDISGFLETVPLDDPAALDVLNRRHLAGVFQFQGGTTKQVVHQLNKITEFEDIVSITALCRPGPLGSGGTQSWINRKNGIEKVEVAHEAFAPYLEKTLGIMVYQEQIMRICREIGGMSWADVTALRKAMGKSLGMEYFDGYRDKFMPSALSKGIPAAAAKTMWDGMCSFGMYGFNRAHALAYGLVTYHCCWLKAHHPVEFAAATLDAESDPDKQIQILRELKEEGVDYVPVDPFESRERWHVTEKSGKKMLLGPLTLIKGVGPAIMKTILASRDNPGQFSLSPSVMRKMINPKTSIDTLYPVKAAIDRLGNLEKNVTTKPTPIKDVFSLGGDHVIIGVLVRNHPLNENEPGRVARRGYAISEHEPINALNLHVRDDSEEIFCKVSRWDYPRCAPVLLRGKKGKSLFALKGNVPLDFRMMWVKDVRYLGEIDYEPESLDEVVQRSSSDDGPDGGEAHHVAAE